MEDRSVDIKVREGAISAEQAFYLLIEEEFKKVNAWYREVWQCGYVKAR